MHEHSHVKFYKKYDVVEKTDITIAPQPIYLKNAYQLITAKLPLLRQCSSYNTYRITYNIHIL